MLIPEALQVGHNWKKLKKIQDEQCSLIFCWVFFVFLFSKQNVSCNLWQLFKRPSQSEEAGNVGALRVIDT